MFARSRVSGGATMLCVLGALSWFVGLGSQANGQVVERPDAPRGQVGGFEKADIERDLAVEVKLLSAAAVQPGEPICLEVKLTNRSKELVHHVVRPGDGSEVGWREPHIFYAAWLDKGNNQWEKVPAARYERHKLFVANWQDDVVVLYPGRSIVLREWRVGPETMLELQQPGRVRLQVHYAYRGGMVGRPGARAQSTDKGKMLGKPAFEIVSAPVEFEVVRPLDVVLKVRQAPKATAKTRISEVLDVRLVNRSKEALKVQAPALAGDARLTFEVQSGTPPQLDEQDQPFGKTALLSPGEETGILGDAALSNGIDGTWQVPQAGTIEIRAVYRSSTWKPGAAIKSEWVEVKVVP